MLTAQSIHVFILSYLPLGLPSFFLSCLFSSFHLSLLPSAILGVSRFSFTTGYGSKHSLASETSPRIRSVLDLGAPSLGCLRWSLHPERNEASLHNCRQSLLVRLTGSRRSGYLDSARRETWTRPNERIIDRRVPWSVIKRLLEAAWEYFLGRAKITSSGYYLSVLLGIYYHVNATIIARAYPNNSCLFHSLSSIKHSCVSL